MSGFEEPIRGDDGFEASVRGEDGEVPMPSIGAESRGRTGEPEDQEVAEDQAGDDPHRVVEGYVHPGAPHTD